MKVEMRGMKVLQEKNLPKKRLQLKAKKHQ